MTNHTRIERNMGRVEFTAALKKIQKLLEAGYDRKKIHNILSDKGFLTMSYGTFCAQMKKFKDRLGAALPLGSGRYAESSREVPPKKSAAAIPARPSKDEPFSLIRNPSLKDLV